RLASGRLAVTASAFGSIFTRAGWFVTAQTAPAPTATRVSDPGSRTVPTRSPVRSSIAPRAFPCPVHTSPSPTARGPVPVSGVRILDGRTVVGLMRTSLVGGPDAHAVPAPTATCTRSSPKPPGVPVTRVEPASVLNRGSIRETASALQPATQTPSRPAATDVGCDPHGTAALTVRARASMRLTVLSTLLTTQIAPAPAAMPCGTRPTGTCATIRPDFASRTPTAFGSTPDRPPPPPPSVTARPIPTAAAAATRP